MTIPITTLDVSSFAADVVVVAAAAAVFAATQIT